MKMDKHLSRAGVLMRTNRFSTLKYTVYLFKTYTSRNHLQRGNTGAVKHRKMKITKSSSRLFGRTYRRTAWKRLSFLSTKSTLPFALLLDLLILNRTFDILDICFFLALAASYLLFSSPSFLISSSSPIIFPTPYFFFAKMSAFPRGEVHVNFERWICSRIPQLLTVSRDSAGSYSFEGRPA